MRPELARAENRIVARRAVVAGCRRHDRHGWRGLPDVSDDAAIGQQTVEVGAHPWSTARSTKATSPAVPSESTRIVVLPPAVDGLQEVTDVDTPGTKPTSRFGKITSPPGNAVEVGDHIDAVETEIVKTRRCRCRRRPPACPRLFVDDQRVVAVAAQQQIVAVSAPSASRCRPGRSARWSRRCPRSCCSGCCRCRRWRRAEQEEFFDVAAEGEGDGALDRDRRRSTGRFPRSDVADLVDEVDVVARAADQLSAPLPPSSVSPPSLPISVSLPSEADQIVVAGIAGDLVRQRIAVAVDAAVPVSVRFSTKRSKGDSSTELLT